MKGLFDRSMKSNETIMIFYIDKENSVTQRYIRVISIHEDFLTAYCYWRKQVRHFKLENILSAGPVRRSA